MEFDESVQDYVLEHAQSPYHRGKCCAATHCHRALNMPCGDEVEFSLRVESGIVREAWFVGRGCVISQAAASMLAQAVEGRAVSEITEFSAQHMLDLFRAPLTPARRKCCLLAWQALRTALLGPGG